MTMTLQDLVLRRLAELGDTETPLSVRQATERAQGLLSFESLRRIARGEHSGRISDRVAEGLSLALGVPAAEIYDAAGVQAPLSPWELPQTFDRLDREERALVEDVARGLLRARAKSPTETEQR